MEQPHHSSQEARAHYAGLSHARSFLHLIYLGFVTGNPRVGKSQPAPVPAHTAPITGTGTHHTRKVVGSDETRGTIGTRGFGILHISQKQHARQVTCIVRDVR